MFKDKSLIQSTEDPSKNRKRGKGKIKIIKRQHVDNQELVKELLDFKATILNEQKEKDIKVQQLQKELDDISSEYKEYSNLKMPRKEKLDNIKTQLRNKKNELKIIENKKCNGKASERLGEIFVDLIENYATKSSFASYTFLEEMKSRATFFLLKYSPSFNPEKSNNAFAYCTQIVKNAFIQVIKKEKKRIDSRKQFVEDYYRNLDYSKKEDPLL